jgi:hypothetical protein
LRALSLPSSIFSSQDQTKFVLWRRLSTDRTFPMWPTFWQQYWCSSLSSTSKVLGWCYQWGQRVLVGNKDLTLSSYSIHLTCPSFCRAPLSPTCILSHRFVAFRNHFMLSILCDCWWIHIFPNCGCVLGWSITLLAQLHASTL